MQYFRTPSAHAPENPPIEELQWLIGKLPFPFCPDNPLYFLLNMPRRKLCIKRETVCSISELCLHRVEGCGQDISNSVLPLHRLPVMFL
jgi:hypothetical protein